MIEKKVNFINLKIKIFLLCVIMGGVLSVSSCMIVGSAGDDDKEASEKSAEQVTTTVQSEITAAAAAEKIKLRMINPKFEEYLKVNEDIVGYIKIESTNIDYPVVYSGDNEYYLTHNIYKQEDKYGAVFMDMTARGAAVLEKNTIIHGHNFYDEILFHHLEAFKRKDYFDYYKTVQFDTLYADMEWEIFAVYVIHADDYFLQTSFSSHEDYVAYIEKTKAIALHWRDFTPAEDDYILSLHTCSGEFKDAHTIVHAKLVNKTEYWQETDDDFLSSE